MARRNELIAALLGAGYFFLILCTSYLLKPLRDSSFLTEFHPHVKPLFNLLTLVVLFLAAYLYDWAVRKFKDHKFILLFYLTIATNLLLFRWLFPLSPKFIGAIFYFWLSTANVFLVTLFWTQINGSFVRHNQRYWYVVIGLGGGLGGALGGKITSWVVPRLGTDNLIWVALALLALAYMFSQLMDQKVQTQPFAAHDTKNDGDTFKQLLKNRYAVSILALVVIGTFVQTLFDFQLTTLVAQSIEKNKDAYALFYGNLYWKQNTMSLLAQILLGPLVLASIGPSRGLFVLPLLIIASCVSLLSHQNLAMMEWVVVIYAGSSYSIIQMFREQLYVPAATKVKVNFKGFIDTFGFRAGDALAAITFLVVISLIGLKPEILDYIVAASGLAALYFWLEAHHIYSKLFPASPPKTQLTTAEGVHASKA